MLKTTKLFGSDPIRTCFFLERKDFRSAKNIFPSVACLVNFCRLIFFYFSFNFAWFDLVMLMNHTYQRIARSLLFLLLAMILNLFEKHVAVFTVKFLGSNFGIILF